MKEQRKGKGMKDTNIQWHPAFVSAMQLEFKEDREKLLFEKEHNLNTKPLQIDLLVIRKENSSDYMDNEIGRLFRKYNVIEYKSPKQQLDIDVFYKTQSYAALYKSYGKASNERRAKDITVSIIRDRKPENLFQYFIKQDVMVENPFDGIYYILNEILFPTQIIVTKELDGEQHTWLKSLTDKIEENDMRRLLMDTSHLKEKQDKEFADSVLEVCFRANEQIIEKLKGDDTMSEALLEIMEPLIEPIIAEKMKPIIAERERMIEIRLRKEVKDEIIKEVKDEITKEVRKETEADVKKAEEKATKQGIMYLIDTLQDYGHNDKEIMTIIMKKYGLSEKEASSYFVI